MPRGCSAPANIAVTYWKVRCISTGLFSQGGVDAEFDDTGRIFTRRVGAKGHIFHYVYHFTVCPPAPPTLCRLDRRTTRASRRTEQCGMDLPFNSKYMLCLRRQSRAEKGGCSCPAWGHEGHRLGLSHLRTPGWVSPEAGVQPGKRPNCSTS